MSRSRCCSRASGRKAIRPDYSLGAPLQLLESKGSWNAILTLQDTHVLRSAGFDLLEHLHFDQIAPGLSQATADAAMTRVGRCAREHFSESFCSELTSFRSAKIHELGERSLQIAIHR